MNLVWFKNDLRVYDHPALSAAMRSGETIAVYCLAQKQWQAHGDAESKQNLIIRQLYDLDASLRQLNVPLIILDCQDYSGLEDRFLDFIEQHTISAVYLNQEYALNESRCIQRVCQGLSEAGVQLSIFHDQCLIAPGQIRTQQGGDFKVFTAFKKKFVSVYFELSRGLIAAPEVQDPIGISSDLSALAGMDMNPKWAQLWPEGEDHAHDQLNHFLENQVNDYHEDRDLPNLEGTSHLSPYLAIGVLTTAQCMRAALSLNTNELVTGKPGLVTWINELIWREFYRHVLASNPDLSRSKAFRTETDLLPWQTNQALFECWKAGKTGYPIVDAAMRQLKETGWMHNRLRMITAMFLTKDLFIDWRWGERYFMENLVDGDYASNNGGWQWAASTGVDAAPYFRVFNPLRQSQRFDPNGEFIRRFVPELRHLDQRAIHDPSREQRLECGYPEPVINHQVAVAETKRCFQQLSSQHVTSESAHV